MTFNWDASKYASLAGLQAEAGERLIKALRIQSHESVLDIGCGVGNLTLKLAALAREGLVLGIDASPSMIEKAKELAKRSNRRNIEFQVMGLAQAGFQGRFDGDFPCAYLAPMADGAAQYPHNFKAFNLCKIRKIGLERWIEEAGQIREKYFTGKFIVGKGQAD
ncbi:MAG: methyltransferase domain-containing protein [Nitrospiraceae bacterium]|nr:methyltransferase domain-containing protein [Nitrospiraceae bacterium]